MGTVTLVHDCDVNRRGDGSAPADQGGDFRDCHINSGAPDNAYDGTQFNVGLQPSGKGGVDQQIRALLWFDLNSFIPASATIINAVWHFCIWSTTATSSHSHRILRLYQTAWVEGPVTWNNYDGVNPWGNPGGDMTTPLIILGPIIGTGWKSFNIFSMVSDAWTNRSGICTFLLRRFDTNPTNSEIMIHAKNKHPYNPTQPHHLRITYTLDGRTFQAIVT